MIKNYFKIALRILSRQKLYSLINISGLAVGLAVCMLVTLYVAHERSYDRFHTNAKRIFSLKEHLKLGGQEVVMLYTSYVSGPMINQTEPEVTGYTRTRKVSKDVIVENPSIANIKFSESKMVFADANFFNFFSFKLLLGDPSTTLAKPFSLVISKDMAKKYFGTQNPIGKILKIKTDNPYLYTITGVAENVPSNSSIEFDFLASMLTLKMMTETASLLKTQEIGYGEFTTYLLLRNPQDSVKVQRSIQSLIKHNPGEGKSWLRLTALPDVHLNDNFDDSSNIKYLKIFPLVAILILLLALANYMSLSTARSTLRAKEIGVRKVAGASRKSIAIQFYIESFLFVFLSFILGYVLFYFLEPVLLNVLQLKIDTSFLYSLPVLLILLGLLLSTVLIAGSYPSLVLSAFKPVITLKGKMSKQTGGVALRKVFTIFQFTISVGLIICGIIIDHQLYYFRHVNTGINRENVVMVPINRSFGRQYQSFKSEVRSLAGVSHVGTSKSLLYKSYDMIFLPGKIGEINAVPTLSVDKDFIAALNINWKIPPVSLNVLTAAKKVVINETALSKLELPANPIGKMIDFGGTEKYQIAGVVKNFNYFSLETAVGPLCVFIKPDTTENWGVTGCLYAKIKPHTNLPSLIASIQSIYKKYNQDTPFDYSFLDDAFNKQYKAEDKLASIFSIFTIITISLAAMGLFGLAAFTIEQRTKEIGVRKILGASLSSITSLLSVDFLKLVLLAILIGSPIAWWAMHNWLQSFAYRINIQWWMFASAGLLAIIIAIVTISYHALKAAIVNPVKSLRSE